MESFDIRLAIARKRDGGILEGSIWEATIGAYLAGRADDAQLAALLMASVLRGLDPSETEALTRAMVASGKTLEPPAPNCVDKHSSGGVADTASLVVVPLVAACGIPVAKLSGRALGHTGGTLDKLEAIAGVRTDLSPERFAAQVRDVGCAIAAQSDELVPADKRLYALRDRTATVESLGLVAASIVSKKIAAGAPSIVFDVKVGAGAFFRDLDEATNLANAMVGLARAFGRRAAALVTDMNEPLGRSIGTGLEAIEARELLRGAATDVRLRLLTLLLGERMLELAGAADDARSRLLRALESGAAYERFEAMLAAQGAASGALAALEPHALRAPAVALASGFVTSVDAVALGEAARTLVKLHGARAGIIVDKRIGDPVAAGDCLAGIYGERAAATGVAQAFSIGDAPPPARPLVYFETGDSAAVSAARSRLATR